VARLKEFQRQPTIELNQRPGFKHNTTKWDGHQIEVYDLFFDDLRDKPQSLIEIGLKNGESLRYWQEFFHHPDTKIVGLDWIIRRVVKRAGDRFTFEFGDQNNPTLLKYLAEKHGPFSIVIDDGAHTAKQTKNTWDAFWPQLQLGGWYVVEDISEPHAYSTLLELVREVFEKEEGVGVNIDAALTGFSPMCFFKKTNRKLVGIKADVKYTL